MRPWQRRALARGGRPRHWEAEGWTVSSGHKQGFRDKTVSPTNCTCKEQLFPPAAALTWVLIFHVQRLGFIISYRFTHHRTPRACVRRAPDKKGAQPTSEAARAVLKALSLWSPRGPSGLLGPSLSSPTVGSL